MREQYIYYSILEEKFFLSLDKVRGKEILENNNLNFVLSEVEKELPNLNPILALPDSKGQLHYNIYSLFSSYKKNTRNSIQCDLSWIFDNISIIIDQDYNQEDKSLFYIFISYKDKEVINILDNKSIFDFLIDIYYGEGIDIEAKINLIYQKDLLIFKDFKVRDENENLIKSALAYYLIGLKENKINNEQTKILGDLFDSLNLIFKIDKGGNIIFKKQIY